MYFSTVNKRKIYVNNKKKPSKSSWFVTSIIVYYRFAKCV